jgi:dTDP-4-amino-4,6-dideoxygalactose transaminase
VATSDQQIPFNRPYAVGTETAYIAEAVANGHLSGHGPFAERCTEMLQRLTSAPAALMTPSCSAALEMAVILAGIGPGDEVIMPSFTFVSTANAVALRGGTPVFAEIREETLNIDERRIEELITPRTKAIIVVHYGAIGARMEELMRIARAHDLLVIEDAAHCIQATLGGRELGSFGDIATFSFHETKNVQCGEGGALIVNRPDLVERAYVVQDKGTNRRHFLRGQVDKYTWVDVGSSYLPSEIACAFLFAQLEAAGDITQRRLRAWNSYDAAFAEFESTWNVRGPVVPADCRHNGHLYYLLLESEQKRDAFISAMADQGVHTVFHYVPLHSAPAARRFARSPAALPITDSHSKRLVRLPIWAGMGQPEIERVVEATRTSLGQLHAVVGTN